MVDPPERQMARRDAAAALLLLSFDDLDTERPRSWYPFPVCLQTNATRKRRRAHGGGGGRLTENGQGDWRDAERKTRRRHRRRRGTRRERERYIALWERGPRRVTRGRVLFECPSRSGFRVPNERFSHEKTRHCPRPPDRRGLAVIPLVATGPDR